MITKKSSAKRGRPATGKSRAEIERESSEKYRLKMKEAGKRALRTSVEEKTLENLQSLKVAMNLSTSGEVIDALVEKAMENN